MKAVPLLYYVTGGDRQITTMSNIDGKSKKYRLAGYALFFIVVTVAVIIALWNFFTPRESYSTVKEDDYAVTSIYCEAKTPVDAFFVPDEQATSELHEIKVTFADGKPDKISYRYTGAFATSEKARGISADFHAKYDRYMAENGFLDTILSPYFVSTDETANANLFAEKSTLNNATANLFFLESSDVANFQNYKNITLKKIFSSRGFSCKDA